MKQCNKCKQQLELNAFYKDKTNQDGLQNKCKECTKQNNKQYRLYNINCDQKQYQSTKLPYHLVYLLPNHNYVGVTDNPTYRMYKHKSYNKRNTNNWIELKRFNTREEALKCEAEYHAQGYEGAK